jgi:hypothetical protein
MPHKTSQTRLAVARKRRAVGSWTASKCVRFYTGRSRNRDSGLIPSRCQLAVFFSLWVQVSLDDKP